MLNLNTRIRSEARGRGVEKKEGEGMVPEMAVYI